MFFRNLQIFRFKEAWNISPEQLAGALEKKLFQPCPAGQLDSRGWVPPLGKHSEELVHVTNGKIMLCAKREERIMPPAAIREVLNARMDEIEEREGRRVRGKEKAGLRDEVILDMLPRAFTKSTLTFAYIDPREGWLIVDASAASRAEELTILLRDSLGSLPVQPLSVNVAPHSVFTRWVAQCYAEAGFELENACELRGVEGEGATIRVSKQDLGAEEIQVHLKAGKIVTRLALNYDERMQFVIDDSLSIKSFKFTDMVTESLDDDYTDNAAAEFDARFALMSLELSRMLPKLIDVLGGEPAE